MHVLVLANQKGGVGKTTLALLLASELARRGRSVLLVDCDPQASATLAVDIDADNAPSLADVLLDGVSIELVPQPCRFGFDVIPAEIALARYERRHEIGQERDLQSALPKLAHRYELALLDCPPNLGMLTTNALVAAAHVLVVTQPTRLALKGLSDLADTIRLVQQHYNAKLSVAGVIVNLADRTAVTTERLEELEGWDAMLYDPTGNDNWRIQPPVLPKRIVAQEVVERSVTLEELGRYDRTGFGAKVAEHADYVEALIAGAPVRA